MCVSVIAVDGALAKVKYGNWDKWDEEFPSPETHWHLIARTPGFLRGITFLDTKELICLATSRFICKDKKCSESEKMSLILFSPKNENPEDVLEGTADYQFVLTAFPPDKNKIIIRAYKKDKGILKFLEEWKIPYENHYPVLSSKENKFLVAFKEWTGVAVDVRLVVFNSKKFTLLFDFEVGGECQEYIRKNL